MPVDVDYRATWCTPRRRVAPVLEQLSQECDGRALIARADADASEHVLAGAFESTP
jgi:thioredoxin 1